MRWLSHTAVVMAAALAAAPLSAADLELLSVKKIWDKAPHNAFTDLIRHEGRFLCVFREGAKHVSPDGALRIIASKDGETWESLALITSKSGDLRDAKLCLKPDGMLSLGGASALHDQTKQRHQSFVWESKDGKTWSEATPVGDPDYWLWRSTWHGKDCYNVGYFTLRGGRKTRLYKSTDGKAFEAIVPEFQAESNPNEATIVFEPDGTARCLMLREEGSQSGLIGTAKAPYTQWTWKDLGTRIGGPNMIRLPNGKWLAATRRHDGKVRTSLGWLDPDAGTLREALALPSAGDSSYAGLVWHDNMLWVSYYSTHEKKTSIYLAKVKIN
jgi:hypothetical protein